MAEPSAETYALLAKIVGGVLTVAVLAFTYGVLRVRTILFSLFNEWPNSTDGKRVLNEMFALHLRSKESELSSHQSDPNAHELMRIKVKETSDERFDKLEEMIVAAHSSQTQELTQFRTETFDKLMQLTDKALSLLGNDR